MQPHLEKILCLSKTDSTVENKVDSYTLIEQSACDRAIYMQ